MCQLVARSLMIIKIARGGKATTVICTSFRQNPHTITDWLSLHDPQLPQSPGALPLNPAFVFSRIGLNAESSCPFLTISQNYTCRRKQAKAGAKNLTYNDLDLSGLFSSSSSSSPSSLSPLASSLTRSVFNPELKTWLFGKLLFPP